MAEPATTLMKSRRRIACPKAYDHANSAALQQGFAVGEMVCAAAIRNRSCPLWGKSRHSAPSSDVRFTPKSGHWLSPLGCPLCAKSRQMHRKNNYYSITLSA
jgi:hypothetical protein